MVAPDGYWPDVPPFEDTCDAPVEPRSALIQSYTRLAMACLSSHHMDNQ